MKKVIAAILLWTVSILAFALEFAAVVYVHERWPSLEAPAIFVFLTVGIALGIIALRTRAPLTERITGWAGFACLCLSIFFAIFHGWRSAVVIIYGLVSLAFALGLLWFTRGLSRSLLQPDVSASDVVDHGEPSEQAILADAAEPYMLYPARGKIVRRLIILLVFTAIFGAVFFWALTLENGAVPALASLFFAALCGLTSLLLIYRLVSRKPALVLTHLGLIDRTSALSGGVGPVWWDEVAFVSIFTTPKAFLQPSYRYLEITPLNAKSLLRRQPPIRRFLLRLFSPIPFTWLDIKIPAWMLEPALETVLEQTEHYAKDSIQRRLEEDPPPMIEDAPDE